MDFKIGDKVKLPFDETGTIVKINNLVWMTKYWVKIRKGVFNKTNEIIDFFEKHLILES